MKKWLFVLMCLMHIPAVADTFSSAGHPKANGVNIEISYPDTWTVSEGKRPHIVQVFRDKNHNQCMLQIRNVGQKLSKSEWQAEFNSMSKSDYADIAGDGGKLIAVKATKYEGYAGAIMETANCMSRAGLDICMHGLNHIFGYIDSMIIVQCYAAGATEKQAKANFDKNNVGFLMFGNNIILPDKYTENNITQNRPAQNINRDSSAGFGILLFIGAIILLFLLPKVIKIYSEKLADKVEKTISNKKDNKNDK